MLQRCLSTSLSRPRWNLELARPTLLNYVPVCWLFTCLQKWWLPLVWNFQFLRDFYRCLGIRIFWSLMCVDRMLFGEDWTDRGLSLISWNNLECFYLLRTFSQLVFGELLHNYEFGRRLLINHRELIIFETFLRWHVTNHNLLISLSKLLILVLRFKQEASSLGLDNSLREPLFIKLESRPSFRS